MLVMHYLLGRRGGVLTNTLNGGAVVLYLEHIAFEPWIFSRKHIYIVYSLVFDLLLNCCTAVYSIHKMIKIDMTTDGARLRRGEEI